MKAFLINVGHFERVLKFFKYIFRDVEAFEKIIRLFKDIFREMEAFLN
jgi:hypothetical protein